MLADLRYIICFLFQISIQVNGSAFLLWGKFNDLINSGCSGEMLRRLYIADTSFSFHSFSSLVTFFGLSNKFPENIWWKNKNVLFLHAK